MRDLFLDFETYYDKAFSLRKMTTVEYIKDQRFAIHGFSAAYGDDEVRWYEGIEADAFLASVDWADTNLVCHNTAFDGAILSFIYGYTPCLYSDTMSMANYFWEGRANLDVVARRLGFGAKTDGLADTLGLKVGTLPPHIKTKFIEYANNDVTLTRRIYQALIKYLPYREQRMIDVTIRMYTQPSLLVNADEMEAYAEGLADALFEQREHTIAALVAENQTVGEKTFSSNKQFAALLEALGVEVPTKLRKPTKNEVEKKGYDKDTMVEVLALGKGDENFLALLDHEDLIVRTVVGQRIAEKSRINETRAKRFATISRLMGGKLPVPLRYMGAHCVPGTTEVLTRSGWVPIAQWDEATPVAVYEPVSKSVAFTNATKYVGPVVSDWVRLKGAALTMTLTPGHKVLYHTSRGEVRVAAAADVFNTRGRVDVPVTGAVQRGADAAIENQLRFLVATQADGHFTKKCNGEVLRFRFKRKRKIERLRWLMTDLGLVFEEKTYSAEPDVVVFIIRKRNFPSWISRDRKHFGGWLLTDYMGALHIMPDELVMWDGTTDKNGSRSYSTTNHTDAVWVQTVMHLVGWQANIKPKRRKVDGWAQSYTVNLFKTRGATSITMDASSVLSGTPMATFCMTTETGYWLARENGRIFVTGNTGRWSGRDSINLQNLPSRGKDKTLRKALLAPPGYRLVVADLSQIEPRVLAWLAGEYELLEAFAAGKDIYTTMHNKVFGSDYDTMYNGYKDNDHYWVTQRNIAKAMVLGLGYGMGYKKFRVFLKNAAKQSFTEDEAKELVTAYRRGVSGITALWKAGSDMVEVMSNYGYWESHRMVINKTQLVMPSNNWMDYPGLKQYRIRDYKTGQVKVEYRWGQYGENYIYGALVIENIVQALSRDIMADMAARIYDEVLEPDERIANLVHDEVVCVIREDRVERAKELVREIMSTAPSYCPGLPVNCSIDDAMSYGDAK